MANKTLVTANAAIDAATLDRTNGQAGVYAPPVLAVNSTLQISTANRAYFMRFMAPRAMSVTKIAFATTIAATNNDACDVGIFSSDLATLIASAGATTGKLNATAGVQTINVTAALTAGTIYYAAFSVGTIGGTAATLVSASFNNLAGAALFGATAGLLEAGIVASAHPLVAGGTIGNLVSSFPILAIRES